MYRLPGHILLQWLIVVDERTLQWCRSFHSPGLHLMHWLHLACWHALSSYRLQEHTTRGAAIETYDMQNDIYYSSAIDFTSTSPSGTWDSTGVNVHWCTESTYDYYFNDHGRNSFDNAGGMILSYAHAGVDYNNAYWDGSRATYGDGDGINFSPLVCLDIVGSTKISECAVASISSWNDSTGLSKGDWICESFQGVSRDLK